MTPSEYQTYSESLIEHFDKVLNDKTVQKNIAEAKELIMGFGKYMEELYSGEDNEKGDDLTSR